MRFLLSACLIVACHVSKPQVLTAQGMTAEEQFHLNVARSSVTNGELQAHTRFIASDALLGRAPGTQGGRVAAHYIAAQFERIGLEPAGSNGTYFQPVPVLGLRANPVVLVGDGGTAAALSYPDDFVAKPERPDTFLISGGDLVFAGYGIQAPEYDWNDFKDIDVSGKVLLILPDHPGYANPALFGGPNPKSYSTIEYKLEQAAALGAVGVLFVHSESLPVPWEVIRNRWNREILLPLQSRPRNELDFTGWVSHAAAAKLAASSGMDWNVLERRASLKEFTPADFGSHLAIDIKSDIRTLDALNVVAMIRGYEVPERSVIITAHYDYLGAQRGVGSDTDSVFNGARANAASVAALLTAAGAFTSAGISTPTTLRFVATTAGESGGLGMQSFLWNLAANHESAQAAIIFEEANLWGPSADISIGGSDGVTQDPAVLRAAEAEGLAASLDRPSFQVVHMGDDRTALMRNRVPFAAIRAGTRLPGDAPGARRLTVDTFYSRHFGRTSDNMLSEFNFDGVRSQVRFAVTLAWELTRVAAAVTN